MRLTCPNCDAQYEVDAALIPPAGRDVQCSNCGQTWFQEPRQAIRLTEEARVVEEPAREPVGAMEGASGDGLTDEAAAFFAKSDPRQAETFEEEDDDQGYAPAAAAPAAETARAGVELYDEAQLEQDEAEEVGAVEPEPQPTPEPEQDEAIEPRSEDVSGDALEAGADADEPEPDEDEAPEPLPETAPDRPEIDAAVLGILRAEAEREIAARRAEAEGVETQPDLGLSEPDRNRESVEARTARLRGLDEDEPAAEEASGRKTLLPDIDEINSTLTATSDRADAQRMAEMPPPEVTQKRRSGFRMGFAVVMLSVAVLILLYLFAPQLGSAAPGLEPMLAGYVDWANGIRQGVDGYLERSVNSLTSFLIELSS